MLKSLDVLINFTLVMLLASVCVTVLTQIVMAVLNSRGTHLRDGLATLLREACPELGERARELAATVLRHPLIAAQNGRLGAVIRREELIGVLQILAVEQSVLRDALAGQGAGGSIDRLTAWFDDRMDRVSHAFQSHARLYTALFALLLAAGAQLDAVGLLHRLAADESLRTPLLPAHWLHDWSPAKIPGILLSSILMSLGAPFWYDALKDLLRLRPLLTSHRNSGTGYEITKLARELPPANSTE